MCRFVKKRTARDFGAPRDFDEATLHQRLQHAVDINAAYVFDIGARDWLAISNDCECLKRGRAQASRLWNGKKLAYPFCQRRIAGKLPAFRLFD